MAESKQYVTQQQENGAVLISEDVITTIVAHAIDEVEGVVGLNSKPGADIIELIGNQINGFILLTGDKNPSYIMYFIRM